MWDFLDKLREKNDAQKLLISFLVAFVVTFVIVATWLTAVLATPDKKDEKQETEIKRADEVTPLSNIGEQVGEIKSIFGELMSQFDSAKEVIYELPEVEEEVQVESATTTETTELNSTTTLEIESSVE